MLVLSPLPPTMALTTQNRHFCENTMLTLILRRVGFLPGRPFLYSSSNLQNKSTKKFVKQDTFKEIHTVNIKNLILIKDKKNI